MHPLTREKWIIKNNNVNNIGGLVFLESILHDKPKKLIRIAKKMYPQAAAYIKAKEYARSAYPAKAFLGERAVNRILSGEYHTKVIDDMRHAWRMYVQMHITVKVQ